MLLFLLILKTKLLFFLFFQLTDSNQATINTNINYNNPTNNSSAKFRTLSATSPTASEINSNSKTKRRLPSTPSNLESHLNDSFSVSNTANNSVPHSPYSSNFSINESINNSSLKETNNTIVSSNISNIAIEVEGDSNNYTRGTNEIIIELNQQLENLNLNIKNQISPKYNFDRSGSSIKQSCSPSANTSALQPHEHVTEWLNSNSLLAVTSPVVNTTKTSNTPILNSNAIGGGVNTSTSENLAQRAERNDSLISNNSTTSSLARQQRSRSVASATIPVRIVADKPLVEINLSKNFYMKKNSLQASNNMDERRRSFSTQNSPVMMSRFYHQSIHASEQPAQQQQHQQQQQQTAGHFSSASFNNFNNDTGYEQQTAQSSRNTRIMMRQSGHSSTQNISQFQNEDTNGDVIQKIRLYKNPKELSSNTTLNMDRNIETSEVVYHQRRPSQSLGIDITARQRLDDLDSNSLAAVISAVHQDGLMVRF